MNNRFIGCERQIGIPVGRDRADLRIHPDALTDAQRAVLHRLASADGFEFFCTHFAAARRPGRICFIYYANGRLTTSRVTPTGRITGHYAAGDGAATCPAGPGSSAWFPKLEKPCK